LNSYYSIFTQKAALHSISDSDHKMLTKNLSRKTKHFTLHTEAKFR